MQILIDIPHKLYEAIKNDEYGVHKGQIYDSIKNGTPLKRPQNKWKKIGEEYYNWHNHTVIKCLRCGYVKNIPVEITPHFCEDCGADMRGKEE
jgi:hypothetical protein